MEMFEDGGRAFPWCGDLNETPSINLGMTLRDYFAIHSDQPGAQEIVTAAGLRLTHGLVWSDESESFGAFNQWWGGLSNNERFALSAKVRYQQADAMLKARCQS